VSSAAGRGGWLGPRLYEARHREGRVEVPEWEEARLRFRVALQEVEFVLDDDTLPLVPLCRAEPTSELCDDTA
jgi:hypothetical protein